MDNTTNIEVEFFYKVLLALAEEFNINFLDRPAGPVTIHFPKEFNPAGDIESIKNCLIFKDTINTWEIHVDWVSQDVKTGSNYATGISYKIPAPGA